MGAIPVNFREFKKCHFAFKYGCGGHLEFRPTGKMPGIFQRYLGAKFLQKGPKKRKMLRNNLSTVGKNRAFGDIRGLEL